MIHNISEQTQDAPLRLVRKGALPQDLDYQNTDCISFLKSLPSRSVSLIAIDPPYYRVVKDKWDSQWNSYEEYFDWCSEWLTEMERVMKYSCSVWIFGYSYQLSKILPNMETNANLNFRQQITIDKGMRSVAGRISSQLKMFPTTTEYAYFLHYEARDVLQKLLNNERTRLGMTGKDCNALVGKATSGGAFWSTVAGPNKPREFRVYPTRQDWEALQTKMILPSYDDYVFRFNLPQGVTDVWGDINFYDKSEKKFHSTQKPIPLMERIINCSSKEGDIVLDFFGGSATTAVACKRLNRTFWGCEIDPVYYSKGLNRIRES
jgi:adenine-specific DNA-methyltransferase